MLRDYYFAIENGGSRHPVEAKNLKLRGVTPGIPDTMLAIPSSGFHGLFIEYKSDKGKLTCAQINKIAQFREMGYRVEIVREPLIAIDIFRDYLK